MFMVLIAKREGTRNIKDFRPISLLRCICKLISKALTKRLSNVLGLVIRENQHAFVEGRQIMDVVMVANELVDGLVGNKNEGILYKLDIEKSYDYVRWDFVDYMLRRLGFG